MLPLCDKKHASLVQKKNHKLWISWSRMVISFRTKNIKNAGTLIDLDGKALLPAGVDAQTHLRVPGQSQKKLLKLAF